MSGDELKVLRLALGISAADLGEILHVSARTINHWEARTYPVNRMVTDTLRKLQKRARIDP